MQADTGLAVKLGAAAEEVQSTYIIYTLFVEAAAAAAVESEHRRNAAASTLASTCSTMSY